MHVAAQPIEFGDCYRAIAPARLSEGCRKLGTAIKGIGALTCPYRKSNPYVLMVQPSKNGPYLDAPGALNEPSNRRILG